MAPNQQPRCGDGGADARESVNPATVPAVMTSAVEPIEEAVAEAVEAHIEESIKNVDEAVAEAPIEVSEEVIRSHLLYLVKVTIRDNQRKAQSAAYRAKYPDAPLRPFIDDPIEAPIGILPAGALNGKSLKLDKKQTADMKEALEVMRALPNVPDEPWIRAELGIPDEPCVRPKL